MYSLDLLLSIFMYRTIELSDVVLSIYYYLGTVWLRVQLVFHSFNLYHLFPWQPFCIRNTLLLLSYEDLRTNHDLLNSFPSPEFGN